MLFRKMPMKITSNIHIRAVSDRARRGFTLLELLVVITIVAVLSAIVFTIARDLRERAAIARMTSSMRQVTAAFYEYVSDHNDQLPGTTNIGIQPPVSHAYVPSGEGAENTNGGWNDFRSRLGNQLYPYLDSTPRSETNASHIIPVLSDPYWAKAMTINRPEVMKGGAEWAVSMAVNTLFRRVDFPELPADFAPFGKIGDLGGGGPNGTPNGVTPCNMALVAARLPLSRAWWLTQADLVLPQTSNIPENDLNAALRYALFSKRVTAFFDGSVRVIPVGTDMRKPL
jgi:prepilin-type N-terminal cleavage/methylation domain-containing protein